MGVSNYQLVNPALVDVCSLAKYDQRDGLCRGTFSVTESGQFIIWCDPTDAQNPVQILALGTTEGSWIDVSNTAAIFNGQPGDRFSWDRDPYRGYVGDFSPVDPGSDGFFADRSTLVYVGGCALHLAVQAKTAYSDVAMKARSLDRYDRRFFNAPTHNGEYGDPSQPQEAKEGLAVYNGSTWRQRTRVEGNIPAPILRNRLAYIIQAGYPLLEVHVVNATTGGAPVNFNFEAKVWLGITYHTLQDNATTAFHTVPAQVPPWFCSMASRGVVTTKRSALSDELIEKTMRTLSVTPTKSPAVTAVVRAAAKPAGGFKGFVRDIMQEVGIDPDHPLPSIAKLAGRKLLPLVSKLL